MAATRSGLSSLREGNGAPAPSSSHSSKCAKLSIRDGRFRAKSEKDPEGKLWEVRIIEAGQSLTGLNYKAGALKEAVPLFIGLPVYAYRWGDKVNHLSDSAKEGNPRGFVGNLVGRVQEAWWNEEDQAIDGLLAVHDEPTRVILKNAHDAGDIGENTDEPLLGLSIDAEGLKEGSDVERIVRGHSLDIVTRAAAGGEFKRLVAGLEDDMAETNLSDKILAQLTKMQEGVDALASVREQASPVDDLQKVLEGATDLDRKRIAEEVVGLLSSMGLVAQRTQEEAPDGKLAAGLKGLLEDQPKDSDGWRAGFEKLLEELDKEEAGDPKDAKILQLEQRLRSQAMGRELGKLVEELKIVDADGAARLVDAERIKFAEDFSTVEGLKEALEDLIKDKPWLVKVQEELSDEEKAKAEAAAAKLKEEAKAKAGGKPAPRGQTVRLTESHDPDDDAIKTLEKRVHQLAPRLAVGEVAAITEVRKLRLQLQDAGQ